MDRPRARRLLHGVRLAVVGVAAVGTGLALLVLLFAELTDGSHGLFVLWAWVVGAATVGAVVLGSVLVLALAAPSLLGRPDPLEFGPRQRRLLQVGGVLVGVALAAVALLDGTQVSARMRTAVRAAAFLGLTAGALAVASRLGRTVAEKYRSS